MMTPEQREALDRELAEVKIQFAAAALVGIGVRVGFGRAEGVRDDSAKEAWDMAERMVNARLGWLEGVLMPADKEEGNGR